jgi:hypothetical protein
MMRKPEARVIFLLFELWSLGVHHRGQELQGSKAPRLKDFETINFA